MSRSIDSGASLSLHQLDSLASNPQLKVQVQHFVQRFLRVLRLIFEIDPLVRRKALKDETGFVSFAFCRDQLSQELLVLVNVFFHPRAPGEFVVVASEVTVWAGDELDLRRMVRGAESLFGRHLWAS